MCAGKIEGRIVADYHMQKSAPALSIPGVVNVAVLQTVQGGRTAMNFLV